MESQKAREFFRQLHHFRSDPFLLGFSYRAPFEHTDRIESHRYRQIADSQEAACAEAASPACGLCIAMAQGERATALCFGQASKVQERMVMRYENEKAEVIELKFIKSSNPVSVFIEVVWCGDKRLAIKPACYVPMCESEATCAQPHSTTDWLL